MVDLLLDPNTGDALIINGDLVIGPAENQWCIDILQTEPGEYKANAQIGLGPSQYQNGPFDLHSLQGAVSLQLGLDAFKVSTVNITAAPEGGYEIDPIYTR